MGAFWLHQTLIKKPENLQRLVSQKTSKTMNKILRKVVTSENGTASLANIHGYYVGGKTGTAQNYLDKRKFEHVYINFSNSKTKIRSFCYA